MKTEDLTNQGLLTKISKIHWKREHTEKDKAYLLEYYNEVKKRRLEIDKFQKETIEKLIGDKIDLLELNAIPIYFRGLKYPKQITFKFKYHFEANSPKEDIKIVFQSEEELIEFLKTKEVKNG